MSLGIAMMKIGRESKPEVIIINRNCIVDVVLNNHPIDQSHISTRVCRVKYSKYLIWQWILHLVLYNISVQPTSLRDNEMKT